MYLAGFLVLSTNKTDHFDKTEILLKVELSTINHQSYSVFELKTSSN
jgi:hypothetical protein